MPSRMKRLFAAVKIEPDENFLRSIHGLKSKLRAEPIKWVEEQNTHITIKFFGETDESLIPEISETLGNLAQSCRELNFKLHKIGLFGSRYQPRVVWAGIDPPAPLAGLMQTTQKEMEKHGFKTDRQNIVPHLTLGRIKFIKDKLLFQKAIDEYREIQSDPLNIKECILYESILSMEGPKYIVLQKFAFCK